MVARFSQGKILAKRSYVQYVVAVTAVHKEGEIVDIFRPTLLFLVSAIALSSRIVAPPPSPRAA